jgi:uncharacterized membrane protein
MKRLLTAILLALLPGAAWAQTSPLICQGNEPPWTLDLAGGTARLSLLGEEDADFTGEATVLPQLKVQAWRGRPGGGRVGDLVAFVSKTTCGDSMSDAKRPFTARVSLPDGRLLAGCCRPSTLFRSGSGTAAEPGGTPAVALGMSPPKAPAPAATPAAPAMPTPNDWATEIEKFLPALRSCVNEALRTEAVVLIERKPNDNIHMVLRLPDKRYADCQVSSYGPARVIRRGKNAALKPEEQVALLTLLPGQPPIGSCDRTEPALDEKGTPFGWITRKGC